MKQLSGDPSTLDPRSMGSPDEFGRIVAFMCSEPAAFLSGTAVNVDGASTVGLL